jgi:hypothetical protein
MRLLSSTYKNDCVFLKFDSNVSQIKITKLEQNTTNTECNMQDLDMDCMEVKFSKAKEEICISCSMNTQRVVMVIHECNNEDINKAYLIENTTNININGLNEAMMNLFKGKNDEKQTTSKRQIDCGIKNENIYANICKKV